MRDTDECKYEIIRAFKEWKSTKYPEQERVSSIEAFLFFGELRSANSKWLEFKYAGGDKWQKVHSWLVEARLAD